MKTVEELGISQMPWDITPNIYGERDVTAKDSTLVVAYELHEMKPHDAENRRLIAAAPELYDALLAIWNEYEESDLLCGISRIDALMCKVEKALTKAGGEEVEQ